MDPPSADEGSTSDDSSAPADPEPSSGGSAGDGLQSRLDSDAESSDPEPELDTGANAGVPLLRTLPHIPPHPVPDGTLAVSRVVCNLRKAFRGLQRVSLLGMQFVMVNMMSCN